MKRPRGLLLLVLFACAATTGTIGTSSNSGAQPRTSVTNPTSPTSPTPPALAVLLIIDGLPMHQVTGYRGQLVPGGFRRFLDEGAWFANAHYGYALTHTAPGHATIVTGAQPRTHGIIANEWVDPASGSRVYCAGDPAYQYIGHPTRPGDGTSPKNLRMDTIGDVLLRTSPASRVIAISGKDRGAILPAGRRGTAYMYMGSTGQFASTTWYMKAHPAWVDAFHAVRPADAYLGRAWLPLLADDAYRGSAGYDQPWYAAPGHLPLRYGGARPDAAFYGSLMLGPFADELTLAFARAAIAGENLGGRGVTDLLAISLSGHDYVNHSYGAESRLSHDHVLHLDRMLAAFFGHLDQTLGRGNYIAALTADHGFSPVPEWNRKAGRDGGRIDPRGLLGRVEGALVRNHGAGPWIAGFSANGMLLRRDTLAARGLALDALVREAAAEVAAEPGIATAMARADIAAAAAAGKPFGAAVARSFDAERSPDLMLVPKPGWFLGSGAAGTTHGSPHEYDSHVPVMFYGAGRIGAARLEERIDLIDLAPTLARLLGIDAPAGAEGRARALPGLEK